MDNMVCLVQHVLFCVDIVLVGLQLSSSGSDGGVHQHVHAAEVAKDRFWWKLCSPCSSCTLLFWMARMNSQESPAGVVAMVAAYYYTCLNLRKLHSASEHICNFTAALQHS
jgi:hypothetical protein